MAEKILARYLELACGHFSSREIQELFQVWRPEKGLYYCLKESIWVELKPKPEKSELPEEPEF